MRFTFPLIVDSAHDLALLASLKELFHYTLGHVHNCYAFDIRMSFNVVAEIIPILCWLYVARVLRHNWGLPALFMITSKSLRRPGLCF